MAGHTVKTIVPIAFAYKNRAGTFIQEFLDGLQEAKLKAVRCGLCGRVYIPPRSICGRCAAELSEIVELKGEGTLREFIVAHVELKEGDLKRKENPEVIGLIELDGATSLFVAKILARPEEVKPGVRLKAVWADERKGDYSDLLGFEIV